jgi:hypothetical protein
VQTPTTTNVASARPAQAVLQTQQIQQAQQRMQQQPAAATSAQLDRAGKTDLELAASTETFDSLPPELGAS